MTSDKLLSQIQRALAIDVHGGYTPEDVLHAVINGKMQLWREGESLIVTQLIEEPRALRLHFFLAVGDMQEIQKLYPRVEAWGRTMGATSATFVGRKGWARTFLTREEGWTNTLAVFEKGL